MSELSSGADSGQLLPKDFCRLCLGNSDEQALGFPTSSATVLFERIFHCTGVRLADFPDVHPRVCDVCISQLVICEKFVRLCREVDQKLRHLWQPKRNTEAVAAGHGQCNTSSYRQPNADGQVPSAEVHPILPKSEEALSGFPCDGKSTSEEFYVVEVADAHQEYEADQLAESIPDPVRPSAITCDTGAGKESHVPVEKQFNKRRKHTKTAKCTVCGMLQQNLKQHMLVHTGEKRHVCPVCKKAFAQRGNLTYHMNQHTGNSPYRCEQCDKAFKDPQSLRSHKFTHTAERKFQCTVCDETFKYRCSLVVHLRGHTQDKPFSCSECESSFTTSSSLRKHLRTHTGERPYSCAECKKSFKTSASLSLHRLSHTKERRFQCDICERWFSYKNVLRTHMNVHRKERQPAPEVPDTREG